MLRAYQSRVHQVTEEHSLPSCLKGLKNVLEKSGLVVWLSPAVRLLVSCAHFEK